MTDPIGSAKSGLKISEELWFALDVASHHPCPSSALHHSTNMREQQHKGIRWFKRSQAEQLGISERTLVHDEVSVVLTRVCSTNIGA